MTIRAKRRIDDLGRFGGEPFFGAPLHVGQLNFPEWDRFRTGMQGIFDRRFFTNHGPKVRELEERLADHLGVRHAVCMTNGTLALMVAARALELTGSVAVPAFTFIATVQALSWAGLDPVFCDVAPDTHNISARTVRKAMTDEVSAILGVHLWGRPCPVDELSALASERGMRLFFDAAHAVGCSLGGQMIGGFGDVEVFSMHATKVLNSAEGGFATTDDDGLADALRTVRNFHSAETFIKAPLRINAKMSEAQAVMGLLSLEDLPRNCRRNAQLHALYRELLCCLPGLDVVAFDEGEANNHQYLIVDVDADKAGLSRDDIVLLLEGERVLARRYFTPGVHRCPPYRDNFPQYSDALPVTDRLSERLLQLPLGEGITGEDVEGICGLIRFFIENAEAIRPRLEGGDREDKA
ncbi:aminotransferase class I/II-fold pyridoxal phosphate-dependent enzyme [Pseudodesulfovibrio indicus]|uniref:aminotransferase class I/II-fold pyridoxal phosphate-dependent enzyme n=1 Tax=Pseudodesulfovibrio indicus TaxID=1716143 RepID=UPI00292CE92A|nr:aminotransferase class I/II-fold pyridoxal phosphate-dependent enzyme [Pseudodesulfovibrio indicus]